MVALAKSLYLQKSYKDWVMDMVDVEAAFLNALVDTDVCIELPEGLREYMRMQGIELDNNTVIKLLRAQYGSVQSPILWMEAFSLILMSLGLKQCKTDPCLFCLFDKDGSLLAIVVVYCNDCIIAGRSKWVIQIKIGISGQVQISDLGNLKRYLGVDYEFGCDAQGRYIRSSLTEYFNSMVRSFEKDTSSSIKAFLPLAQLSHRHYVPCLTTKSFYMRCFAPTLDGSCLRAVRLSRRYPTHAGR
jgi:hypothetical protein